MDVFLSYIISMATYMVFALPIYIVIRYNRYVKTKKFDKKKEILLLIFAMFMVGLASITIIPKFDANGKLIVSSTRYNFIPFKIIYDTIIELNKGNVYYLLISFLGNIIMFIPIGFFIKKIYNLDTKKIVKIGFLISLSIEIIQIFTGRQTDIDDLILNTLGVYLGTLFVKKRN